MNSYLVSKKILEEQLTLIQKDLNHAEMDVPQRISTVKQVSKISKKLAELDEEAYKDHEKVLDREAARKNHVDFMWGCFSISVAIVVSVVITVLFN